MAIASETRLLCVERLLRTTQMIRPRNSVAATPPNPQIHPLPAFVFAASADEADGTTLSTGSATFAGATTGAAGEAAASAGGGGATTGAPAATFVAGA